MSARFAIAARPPAVRPLPRGLLGGAKHAHNSRVHSATEKLAVAGNGSGVVVASLQQYQQRWGFARLATSRAARPHAFHDQQQQQQQPEKSWKGAFVRISSAGT